ncbi:MAG: hypothetical protein Q7S58_14790 [Candidatus Binatus sp.]|uniref:hypothetical protein n=1 Tax=Candidatus Binatus sp. TaxID=2811406 RepID=UPI00271EAEC3|nr:hypothetical protein [Candidatus Binatus sp.]MDO8433669.1 hypothetical protein [Candidatus Binatus sp.]
MTIDQWLGEMHFWSLLAGVWLLLFACWRPYRLDALRETLFALRDELFLIADDEESLSFSHPAYTELRNHLNSMIRFAEKMTFFRSLVFWSSVPKAVTKSDVNELQGLPLHVQKRMLRIRAEASVAVANHVIYGSPLLLIVFHALQTIGHANNFAKTLVNRVRSGIARPLEAQARDQYRLAS